MCYIFRNPVDIDTHVIDNFVLNHFFLHLNIIVNGVYIECRCKSLFAYLLNL